MPMTGSVSDRIKEFHEGNVYAKTKAKHGKSVADKQAFAAAIHSMNPTVKVGSMYRDSMKKSKKK